MEAIRADKATKQLGRDHQAARDLHRRLAAKEDPAAKAALAEDLFQELEIHARLEERLVYPLLEDLGGGAGLGGRLDREHREVRRLISAFRLGREEGRTFTASDQALVDGLMAGVTRHMAEEEGEAFPLLEANETRNAELGEGIARLRRKLKLCTPLVRRLEVGVPVRVAYNQWTQFEAFPGFLAHVKEVTQLDDAHVRWRVQLGGKDVTWTARIVEQVPDERIAWRSVEGALHEGSASFAQVGPHRTRLLVELLFEPQGLLEDLGALVGVVSRRLEEDLDGFKTFLEQRLKETGAWRGRIGVT